MSTSRDEKNLSIPLDAAEYDPIHHLNLLFSHPTTLARAATTSLAIRRYQDALDAEISALEAAQAVSNAESIAEISSAKDELHALFADIGTVQERARQAESTITDMTADIKRLDNTKKNLTLSMTALKRLQMLTTAYEQLRGLSRTRQYGECAQLLQAVMQLMAHFKSYRSIDQIATLSRNVSDLQRELLEQVCEDFEIIFAKGEVGQRKGMLAEACQVMEALGESAKSRLVVWYCNTQLREYRQVFRGNDEAGSLDNISRRYSWFKRMMATYDEEHAAIFPVSWKVNEVLANAYCEGTRDDFKAILARSARRTDGLSLNVDLLLSCLRETLEFEQGLERKFANGARISIDTLSSKDDAQTPSFARAISEAFEPYLSLWVESQDDQLATLIPRYQKQPLRPADEEFSPQAVAASSVELFHFYRSTLAQCAKLSTGGRLLDLSKTFAKYLDQYAEQVLLSSLKDRPSVAPSSLEDAICILNTADYCHLTCGQLEEKIKSRIDEELRSQVDLQSQADTFMGVASAAIRTLVRKVEVGTEPGWREMRNTPWSRLPGVSDQSSYVGELLGPVKTIGADVLHALVKPQYARAFCDNVVEMVANAYVANLAACRPISEVGAEQMLLDSYAIKKTLSSLLTITTPDTPPPQAYLNRVSTSLSRLDPLLKTLQVRPSPPEALVQAYLIHISDRSDTNFKKILELKGVPRKDHPSLMELFQAHRTSFQSSDGEGLAQSAPVMALVNIAGGNIGGGGPLLSTTPLPGAAAALGGGAGLPPGLSMSRFDAAASQFGSAIMSAARDGVDRLGTPTLGAGGGSPAMGPTPAREGSPAAAVVPQGAAGPAGNLNENLRNIGKFFRRDMGGFSGKWGGQKTSEDA